MPNKPIAIAVLGSGTAPEDGAVVDAQYSGRVVPAYEYVVAVGRSSQDFRTYQGRNPDLRSRLGLGRRCEKDT